MRSRDDPASPPRFPYIAALLCAACLGAAAWTWMRHSYCWEVTLAELSKEGIIRMETWPDPEDGTTGWPQSAYVHVVVSPEDFYASIMVDLVGNVTQYQLTPSTGGGPIIYALGFGPEMEEALNAGTGYLGRINITSPALYVEVDTTASRFHPASIAGLVVGAMGVFVFTVALRHWLGERRRFRRDTPGDLRTSPTSP